jgi:uncharacterized membrane protein (DUF4010 family)
MWAASERFPSSPSSVRWPASLCCTTTWVGFIIIIGFLLLLIAYYVAESAVTHDFGITSELSAVATFILGLMVMLDIIPVHLTIAVFVIVVFLLSIKSGTTRFVAGVSRKELHSFITYAIIALVVLPLLPDYTIPTEGYSGADGSLLRTMNDTGI